MDYLKAHWKCIVSGFVAGMLATAMILSGVIVGDFIWTQ